MTNSSRWCNGDRRQLLTIVAAMLVILPKPLSATEFYLRGGETVVFFGDSITQGGTYIEYVEAYLRTRFPDKVFQIVNHGISSETISGTSEPDHEPRRPDAHLRFARDVTAHQPHVVVACFGMNDGNYHPFEPERFARYQDGVQRLIARCRDEAKARLVLMTPPPFDAYRRRASDPAATHYGYKFPAIDYDQTLRQYSRWLTTLRGMDLVVADVHAATNEHLRQRRTKKVSFSLAPDAVHPDANGHWLMAQTLLLAWNAPAECATAEIDVAGLAVTQGAVNRLANNQGTISFTWRTPLPMPLDTRWDPESIQLEQVHERLNQHRLKVTGLPAKSYRLSFNTSSVAGISAEALARGLDLTAFGQLVTNQRSQAVLRLVQERNKLVYGAWRQSIAAASVKAGAQPQTTTIDLRRAAEIEEQLREYCQPQEYTVRLVPQ